MFGMFFGTRDRNLDMLVLLEMRKAVDVFGLKGVLINNQKYLLTPLWNPMRVRGAAWKWEMPVNLIPWGFSTEFSKVFTLCGRYHISRMSKKKNLNVTRISSDLLLLT